KTAYRIFFAEDRNARLDKHGVGFSSAGRGRDRRVAGNIAIDVELVGIFVQRFPPELPADGKTDAACRKVEQIGREDGCIDRRQLRSIDISWVDAGKLDRRLSGRNGNAEVAEGIEGRRRADEFRRAWPEYWIGLIQDAIETRDGNLLPGSGVPDLAVAEACVVTPGSVEQLVAAKAERGEPGVTFVIEKTVAEFCQARARSAGDDLVKWIKRIESARGYAGIGIGRTAERRCPRGIGYPRRDGERDRARSLKIPRGRWGQLIVGLDVLIHRVAVNDEGIAEDFVIHRDITAVTLGVRKREREFIEVEARKDSA